MQEYNSNKQIDEYDLSIIEGLDNKEFNLQETLKEIMFYLLPIVSFVFFLFLLFTAIFPSIQEIGSKLDQVDKLRTEDEKLSIRIEKINNLNINANTNQQVIDKINEIVPTGNTEVVKFGERINLSIAQNSLVTEGIKLGETSVVSNDINNTASINSENSEVENSLSIREIPSKFNITGSYEKIRDFFIQLYKGSDFFIVDSMSLKSNENQTWSGEISLAKYQFSESKVFDKVKAYTPVSENAVLNDLVMKFIQTRFVNNQIETTK